jgi:hypothetical protein
MHVAMDYRSRGDGEGGAEDETGEAEVADEITDGERTLRVVNLWLARRRQDLVLALLVVAALLVSASTLMLASSAERDRRTARALTALAAAAAAPDDAAGAMVASMGAGPMVAPIELPRRPPRIADGAAAPPPAPTTTAGAPKPAPPAAPAPVATASPAPVEASCQVTLGSRPWSEVWIDGARIGFSPVQRHPVGCGAHEAVFINTELGFERRFLFTARPGAAERHVVDIQPEKGEGAADRAPSASASGVGQACVLTLGSRPWAEVWIDGRRHGVTPLVAHDLPCGRHELLLRNQDLNVERREAIQVQAGEHLRKVVLLASIDDD